MKEDKIMAAKDKTIVTVIDEKDIEKYNNIIGYRKARKKRYGLSATYRKNNKNS